MLGAICVLPFLLSITFVFFSRNHLPGPYLYTLYPFDFQAYQMCDLVGKLGYQYFCILDQSLGGSACSQTIRLQQGSKIFWLKAPLKMTHQISFLTTRVIFILESVLREQVMFNLIRINLDLPVCNPPIPISKCTLLMSRAQLTNIYYGVASKSKIKSSAHPEILLFTFSSSLFLKIVSLICPGCPSLTSHDHTHPFSFWHCIPKTLQAISNMPFPSSHHALLHVVL